MTRWLILAVALVGSVAWAQEPGHYEIVLQGWDASQEFNFTPNPADLNTVNFINNFIPNSSCNGYSFCDDPLIRLNSGGGSIPENGPFSFSTGSGTQTLDFQNTGTPIDSVLITLTSNGGQLNSDQLDSMFTCSSDIFQDCGFYNDAFEIAFWNPSNGVGIPTVPEPSEVIFLLIACAAVVVARFRKGSASSTFAGIER